MEKNCEKPLTEEKKEFVSKRRVIGAGDPRLRDFREDMFEVVEPLIKNQEKMIRTPKLDLLR